MAAKKSDDGIGRVGTLAEPTGMQVWSPNDGHLLDVQNLAVEFRTRDGVAKAINRASFHLDQGESLAILGESGSGKSTLAQAMLGLLPFVGEMEISKQHWQQPAQRNTAHNKALRRQVQVVFQDPFSSLSPRLTVEDFVGVVV